MLANQRDERPQAPQIRVPVIIVTKHPIEIFDRFLGGDRRESTAATGVSADEANCWKREPLAHRLPGALNLLDAEVGGAPQRLVTRGRQIKHQAPDIDRFQAVLVLVPSAGLVVPDKGHRRRPDHDDQVSGPPVVRAAPITPVVPEWHFILPPLRNLPSVGECLANGRKRALGIEPFRALTACDEAKRHDARDFLTCQLDIEPAIF